jgi:hypothetical protein
MSRIAPVVPAESDLLCEECGYTLNGLPHSGRCPECGKPVAESIGTRRTAPPWEIPGIRPMRAFVSTSIEIIFRPSKFYRTLPTRADLRAAKSFALLHWLLAAFLFSLAAYVHTGWYFGSIFPRDAPTLLRLSIFTVLAVVTYLALFGVTVLAAKLTNWEATYRGYRMPMNVVLRGMYYHAAHYLPVALVALFTVVGYRVLVAINPLVLATAEKYLYVIAAEVILGAIYLFQTYWIGMRNMMYANR